MAVVTAAVKSATKGNDRERGATVVELAIIMPIVLAVILLMVQSALWFHGRQVADAAAPGRGTARPERLGQLARAREGAGQTRSSRPSGRSFSTAPRSRRGSRMIGVASRSTATAVQVVPLLPSTTFTITSRFGGPIECFRPDEDTAVRMP